jgi:multisubunit Na+/H+ antiporter MnhG subunit
MCSRGALLRGIGQAVGVKNLPDVYKRYFGPQETNVLGAEIIGRARNLYQCDREYILDNGIVINFTSTQSFSLWVFLMQL